MSWQVPVGRHADESGERAQPGFDSRPTMVVPAENAAAASTFPTSEVRRAGAVARTGVRDVGYTVVFLALFVAAANARTIAGWLGAAGESWVATAIGVVCILVLVVVVIGNLVRVATWQMFVAGALLALIGGVATHDSFSNTYLFPAALLAIAVAVHRSRRVRQGRWLAIKPIVADHALVEASVLSTRWGRSTGAATVHTVVLTVASPAYPGRPWTGQMTLTGADLDHAPEVGDPIAVFVCPSHPEVAVLRPVARSARG